MLTKPLSLGVEQGFQRTLNHELEQQTKYTDRLNQNAGMYECHWISVINKKTPNSHSQNILDLGFVEFQAQQIFIIRVMIVR